MTKIILKIIVIVVIIPIELIGLFLACYYWVIHPSEVMWLFDEKYIAYTHVEEDFIGQQW